MLTYSPTISSSEIDRLISEYSEEIGPAAELCPEPLVSIACQTFNHEGFLAPALESVLSQKVNFPYEIVIGEDASSDGTLEVAREYRTRFPDRIRLIRSTENLGVRTRSGRLNTIRNFRACRGKYIAFLEGDDFWIDSGKLQKQIDYLEANPSAAGCFTDCRIVDQLGNLIEPRPFWTEEYRNSYTRADCLKNLKSSYGSASLVFRREVFEPEIPEYFLLAGSDYVLDLAITAKGTLDYIAGETSAYRIHDGGIWQGRSSTAQSFEELRRYQVLLEDDEIGSLFYEELNLLKLDGYPGLFFQRCEENRRAVPWIEEDEFPVRCVTATLQLNQPEEAVFSKWLDSVYRDQARIEVLLLLRGTSQSELVWIRADARALLRKIPNDQIEQIPGSLDLRLPRWEEDPEWEHFEQFFPERLVMGGISKAPLVAESSGIDYLLHSVAELRKEQAAYQKTFLFRLQSKLKKLLRRSD